MKKTIITALVLAAAASSALAQHHHQPYTHHAPHYQHRNYWPAVGAIIGGVVVYDLYTRPVYPPAVVYAQPAPPAYYATPALCNSNHMIPPRGYRYEYRYDPDAGCAYAYFVPLY